MWPDALPTALRGPARYFDDGLNICVRFQQNLEYFLRLFFFFFFFFFCIFHFDFF